MSERHLERAYAIDGPDDAKALYDSWADRYDTNLLQDLGYVAPREIARIYIELGNGIDPILDVGAGTGMLATHLPDRTVDAIDISGEMLDQAGQKGLYRSRIVGDVLKPLAIPDNTYGGIVSSGTFTHGHVGPACLPELLRISKPGALFVCGCIPVVFDAMGFGSTLGVLNATGQISDLRFRDIPVYEGKDHNHASDRGLVMMFCKL